MPANSTAIGNNIVSLLQGMPTTLLTTCNQQITASGSLQTVTPVSMAGITNGVQLYVDMANPEIVTVSNVTGTTFQAIFTLNHSGLAWTIGLGPYLYKFTKLGQISDPTDVMPCACVTFQSRKTERFNSGWKLNSEPIFQIETIANQSTLSGGDPTIAEQTIMQAADNLTYLFAQRYTLNNAPGVYVTLLDVDDRGVYHQFPNGNIYRCSLVFAKAIQQYNTQLTP